ncbi:pre-rRNA processing protein Utp22 [Ephemerocybe angulata]|uniref:U3 small nucleolar RNA-associated protein 22 n=1 Tax=Ephemerocybe angulata TaxID=980116 RepID=A0A8H6HTF6_9AGAR|nr:pre-rRNA processing protein Utp22 [Tulosesus angulatus]
MALNLKRKRAEDLESRKNPKLDEVMDVNSENEEHGENESTHDDSEDSGSEGEGVEWSWKGRRDASKSKNPAPTGEEVRAIRDATDLYRSSSFKLQVRDKILTPCCPTVRPKLSRAPPLEKFLLKLHTFLMQLPAVEPQHPLEAARKLLKKGVAVPYCLPLPTEDTNWKVSFEKPEDITLVGSWPNKVSVKAKDGLNTASTSLFRCQTACSKKRIISTRGFSRKRRSISPHSPTRFEAPRDPRLTKLMDPVTDFTKLNARVCIIPTISTSSPISLHRLSPSHANIRVNSGEEGVHHPSPLYNNALLTSYSPKPHLLAMYNHIQSIPAYADALTLLRIWANQRGFGEGSKLSVKGFENAGNLWPALLELVISGEEPSSSGAVNRKPLGKGLSSYQLFKAALSCLAKHDFIKNPALVKSIATHKFPASEYQEHSSATLVDSSSLVNALAYVPLGCIDMIRHEAWKTLQTLYSSSLAIDPFTDVFLHDHRDVATRFDIVFQVDLSKAKARKLSPHESLDFGSATNHLLYNMNYILRKALGDRIHAVAFLQPSSTSDAYPSTSSTIFVGLVLNPTHAFNLTRPALAEFQELWGSKSEMRRFKDGRIAESVVWDVKTADERSHVPAMVVRHILQWHFGLSEEHVQTWQSAYDSVIRLPKEIATKYVQGAGSAMGFKGAMQAFDRLVKQVKALEGQIPLSLVNISATSESLRYTSAFNPVPLTQSLACPINIVFEFEQSAKWPDELKAIQKIKLAFFEGIATGLMNSVPGTKASVVLGLGGYHGCQRATLLDRILDDHGPMPHVVVPKKRKQAERKGKEYLDAQEAKEVYDRRFIHAPRHHRAVAALSHQYPAFSGTCRLVKRWFASHWFLGGHVSEEVVELLCAQIFVLDGKYVGSDADIPENTLSVVPSTKERGFAMVMRFLSEWKWEEGGLYVCLYGPKKEGEGEGETGAKKVEPKASSGGVWTVATEVDKDGKVWTKGGPDGIVARRIRALAGATWSYLQTIENGTFNVQGMFIHPTQDYDFVVQLNPSVLPRYVHNIAANEGLLGKGKFANARAKDQDQDLVLPGFDPAKSLFTDLQRTYSDTFRLFADPYGGDAFGAVWDPTLKEPRPFRVLGGFSSVPVKKESEKAKDKIERLGSGLIKAVVKQR